ncbi:hypothetical protein J1605_002004 [Eschrichtius robustus]|uniref:Uncharacterized protein n=1 Tax=Eschrichtius robustus TaxID=9764 RepID=A0AB34HXL9_ESCRO|nr:hypothetical protein J1605_002004 [Eschrichtius robustus]
MLRTPRRLRAFLAQGSIVKLKTERRQLQSFSFDFTFQVDVSCQGSRGHVPLLCALKRIRGFPPPGDTSQESTGEVWREGEKRQQIGFLFAIRLSQLLEGTWSGYFLRLETEAQRSDVTVTGAESDLLPMVVARPWDTMAFKALPELTLPLAVSDKWWCHRQGNGGEPPSGEGQPRVCMFKSRP